MAFTDPFDANGIPTDNFFYDHNLPSDIGWTYDNLLQANGYIARYGDLREQLRFGPAFDGDGKVMLSQGRGRIPVGIYVPIKVTDGINSEKIKSFSEKSPGLMSLRNAFRMLEEDMQKEGLDF